MIEIQKHIEKYSLEETISKFSLTQKTSDDLILLKYNQIKSNLKHPVVKEARGIILEKETNKIISLPFVRFTNFSDLHADKIDWDNARAETKIDGSIIQVYYYNGWNIGTSGTLFGDGHVGQTDITYSELFKSIIDEDFFNKLNKDLNYIFELTTDKHTVVTEFDEDNITLLAVRNRENISNGVYGELTKEEVIKISKELNVDVVDHFKFTSLEEILATFKSLSFQDEGYVVIDDNFNRIKVKNPTWNAAHHNKGQVLNNVKLIDIVKSNEIIEFVEAYPNTKKTITKYKIKYDKILFILDYVKVNKGTLTGGELAGFIHSEIVKQDLNKSIVGLVFSYVNGNVHDVYDFINNVPNKKLLKYIK